MSTILKCAGLLVLVASIGAWAEELAISEPSPELRESLSLSTFYKQCIIVDKFAIVASEKVVPSALLETAWLVKQMLQGRSDILHAMSKKKIRMAVMAATEFTTDIPEHSDLKPKEHWNKRARGLGATLHRPAVSCAEENLLCFKGDPYRGESIMIHEFAHAIHEIGMAEVDPKFDSEVKEAFEHAKKLGLWKNTYAATNHKEYFAEGVQSWFDTNRDKDGQHNHVKTREQLKEYDPKLANLIERVFKDNPFRYSTPDKRSNHPHLAGWDRSKMPEFKWPESPAPSERK